MAVLVLVWMSWDLLVSDHGYRVYLSEKENLASMKADLEALKAEREKLAKEILQLRNDPKALEEMIHRDLGYVYPDEFMLIMPENGINSDKGEGRQ